MQSILYNSTELSIDRKIRELQNQTILFSRKIKSSIEHNPEDTVSVQKDLFFKEHS